MPRRPLALDFAPTQGVRSVRVGTKTIAPSDRPRSPRDSGGASARGPQRDRHRLRRRRRGAQSQPEFLYTLFVPARAHLTFPCFDQPDLKARWTLGLDVPAGWQAIANGAETARSEADGRVRLAFAETEPLSDLPLRVCRRPLLGRDRRARRPHVPHVPPRDRRRQGRAQPRRDLRSARVGARLARALHRHPVSVGQVRLPARAVVSVRRHGARRARSSTTRRACCSIRRRPRIRSSAAPASSRTKPRTCGSAIS